MTQIFTGEGLGLHGSSLGLGNYGPQGVATLGQGGESVYVNAANGNLVLRQSDGFLADIGFGVDLFQTYNSRGEGLSSWCFNLQSRLEFSGDLNKSGSVVIRIDEDGHRSRFLFDTQKQAYLPEGGGTSRLTYSQNGWIYREGSQKTACHYNLEGQLQAIRDLDGHSITFNYHEGRLTHIVDQTGKQTISWSFKNGFVSDVTTSSEGVIIHHLHYEYDDQHRIHRVSRDLGQGKTFWITYDYAGDSNRINDIKQSDGTALHIEYDASGRVKQLVDAEGRISSYAYEAGKTTVTNGLGEAWIYYYDDKNRLTGVDGAEHYRIRYHYEGELLSSIIHGSQIWTFRYNEQGDCIRIEEPSGQITEREYNNSHQVIFERSYQRFDGSQHPIDPKTSRYLYDERGHLRFIIAADGTVTERRYDEEGQLISTRCYLHSNYIADALAQDMSVNCEQLQLWVNQQNPQGVSLIEYRYDWRGQLSEEVHYAQVDAFGQGLSTDALSTRSRYDAAGRLIEKSVPVDGGWSVTQYLYDDLGRLIQTIDNQNHSQRIEYDEAHQRVIETDVHGVQTIRLYDRSGLLLSVIKIDKNNSYGTTTYQYDVAGRLIAQTGIDGHTAYTFYDSEGRVRAQVDSRGQMTETFYNEEGFVIKTRQYQQLVSTTGWLERYPVFVSIKPQNNALDRITQIVYNACNQIAYRIDAQGAVLGYEYDAQGQVVSVTAYAKKLNEFNPEQKLTLSSIRLNLDLQDRVTHYYYDAVGRLKAQINGEGYATAYRYDKLGNVIETIRYLNPATKLLFGDWSQDKPEERTSKDIHTYTLYDGRGLKVADIDGEGFVIEYRYDARGLLLEQYAYEEATSWIPITETTTLAQIRPQRKNNDHITIYQYNDLGLLISEKTHTGLITTYSYDELGRLLTKTVMDGYTQASRQQQYRYDVLGRVIQSLDEQGCALLQKGGVSSEQVELIWQNHSNHYEYSNSGLLLRKTNAMQQTTHYFYDEAGALRYCVNADGAVTETQYNAFGQIIYTRSFCVYLKEDVKEFTTQSLTSRLKLVQNDALDEWSEYEYNTLGQVIAKHSGNNTLETNVYNVFGELEHRDLHLDATHQTRTVYEYDKRGLLTRQTEDVDGLAKHNAMEYDAFGWVTKIIDGRQNQTRFILNKRGEREILFNGNNQCKIIDYDAFNRVLKETDYTHTFIVKVFTYDDKNKTFTYRNQMEGTEVVTRYNAFGDTVSILDAKGHTTNFHFDEQGQLIRTDAPEHTSKMYRYDAAGHLIWQEDAQGQIIEYRYDAAGHVLSKTLDPEHLNITTSYQYDALGRQVQITDANGCIKYFIYDNQGHLIQSRLDPDGLNLVTDFSYDYRGLLLRQSESNAQGVRRITAYEWDHLGRRIATIIDPDGLKATTTYEYDAADNLVGQVDPNQHRIAYLYDANNRCRYEVNSRGAVTEHVYDVNGNERQTVAFANTIPVLPHYDLAAMKSLIQEDSIRDQNQFRLFNSRGQVLISYDALGYPTSYRYDKNGNVVHICQYAKNVSIESLKQGNIFLPSITGAREQYLVYDGLNQLRFKYSKKGYVTESQYDKSGQLVQITHNLFLQGRMGMIL